MSGVSEKITILTAKKKDVPEYLVEKYKKEPFPISELYWHLLHQGYTYDIRNEQYVYVRNLLCDHPTEEDK